MALLTFIVQIIIYSLLPLLGVFYFGWDWRQILILFWLENLTVGLKTVIGMARSNTSAGSVPIGTHSGVRLNSQLLKIGGIAFFILHYGLFTLIHGVFVFALVSGVFSISSSPQPTSSIDIFALFGLWAIAGAAHIIRSFVQPPPTSTLARQFSDPYKRIIPLHFAIVFGAFVMILLDLPSSAVIILIVVKMLVDIMDYKSVIKADSSVGDQK